MIRIASLKLPDGVSLCTKDYQQAYRLLNAKSDAYKLVGCRHCSHGLCLVLIAIEWMLNYGNPSKGTKTYHFLREALFVSTCE